MGCCDTMKWILIVLFTTAAVTIGVYGQPIGQSIEVTWTLFTICICVALGIAFTTYPISLCMAGFLGVVSIPFEYCLFHFFGCLGSTGIAIGNCGGCVSRMESWKGRLSPGACFARCLSLASRDDDAGEA